jgi:hypothetical protein
MGTSSVDNPAFHGDKGKREHQQTEINNVETRHALSQKHFKKHPLSQKQPASSIQKQATSNQQPASSIQHPATSNQQTNPFQNFFQFFFIILSFFKLGPIIM